MVYSEIYLDGYILSCIFHVAMVSIVTVYVALFLVKMVSGIRLVCTTSSIKGIIALGHWFYVVLYVVCIFISVSVSV